MSDEQQIPGADRSLGDRRARRRPGHRAGGPRTGHRHVRRAASRSGGTGDRRLPRYLAAVLPSGQASGAVFEIESLVVTSGTEVAFAYALLRCGTAAELARDPERRLAADSRPPQDRLLLDRGPRTSLLPRYSRPGRDTLVQRGAVMRKNWLAAAWAHWFRAKPLVPEAAFQGTGEPFPGHWRRFPEPWPSAPAAEPDADARTAQHHAAREDPRLPGCRCLWRRVVVARYLARRGDRQAAC